MNATVETLDSVIQQGSDCIDSIKQELQFEPNSAVSDEKANAVIEKFIEESAEMVEKIHMLSNQNKQLMLENDEMRKALEASTDTDQPLVAGLKLKLESQKEELIALQKSFHDLEQRYLSLYEEKSGSNAPPLL